MFVQLAIHTPIPGKEAEIIDSMHRFGAAMRDQPGLQRTHTLRDQKTGRLVGLAIWDTREQWIAARPLMQAAVQNDPFQEWENEPPEVFFLEEV